jgi:hypothetical protein
MAKFIRLEESKAFLNLEYVSLVTEQAGGGVAVNIIDQDHTQVVSGDDAHNLLAALKMESDYRSNAKMLLCHSFPRKPHQQVTSWWDENAVRLPRAPAHSSGKRPNSQSLPPAR